MQTKKKICKGCSTSQYIYARGMCLACDRINTPEKHGAPKRTELKKTPLKRPAGSKPTGELALFELLWGLREHKSFISGLPILEPSPSNFAHVLSKAANKYPKFKLYDRNIVFLTAEEHHLFDHGSLDQREKYARSMLSDHGVFVDWGILYKLKETLINVYHGAP